MFGAFYFAQGYFSDFPVFGSAPTPPAPAPAASTASPIYGLGGGTGVLSITAHYEPDFGRRAQGGVRTFIAATARLRINLGLFARHSTNRTRADDEDLISIISASLDDD